MLNRYRISIYPVFCIKIAVFLKKATSTLPFFQQQEVLAQVLGRAVEKAQWQLGGGQAFAQAKGCAEAIYFIVHLLVDELLQQVGTAFYKYAADPHLLIQFAHEDGHIGPLGEAQEAQGALLFLFEGIEHNGGLAVGQHAELRGELSWRSSSRRMGEGP